MLSGLADEHVKSGIVEGLRRRGVDVVTVQELELNETDDKVLLTEATRQGRLMLSCDADFLAIHHEWLRTGRPHAGIVYWIRKEHPVAAVIRGLTELATTSDPAAIASQSVWLRRWM